MDGRRLPRLTRRRTVVAFAGVLAGAVLSACRGGGSSSSRAGLSAGSPSPASAARPDCVLAAEQTEGPYYIADEQVRRDITEGLPGTPLHLRTTVLDAVSCVPLAGAAVDVWHCDAAGVYSGFGAGADSRTFLRGVQTADEQGLAVFETIYPGWYPGRTVHIHLKVHAGGSVVHTGQLYFPDELTDVVYRAEPYAQRPGRDTRNGDDGIYAQGGQASTLRLRRREDGGYVGEIALGVRRA